MRTDAVQTNPVRAFAPLAATLAAILAGLLLTACDSVRKVDERQIERVEIAEVQRLVARAAREESLLILLDARPADQFNAAHLPGARNVRPEQIDPEQGKDSRISRYDHIIVYGEHPNSAVAKALTKRLMSARYKKVRLFDGGVDAWRRAGLSLYASE